MPRKVYVPKGNRTQSLIRRNQACRQGRIPYENREWLRVKYEVEGLSLRQIAREAECGLRTIARWMQTHGIAVRRGSEARAGKMRTGANHPEWRGGPNPCAKCGAPRKQRVPDRLCLKCRDESYKAEGNPNYRGLADVMVLLRQRAKDYWRSLVFERDRYTCQECGDARGGNLQAHHIEPLSKIVRARLKAWEPPIETPEQRLYLVERLWADPEICSLENGVTLCDVCHVHVHKTVRTKHTFRRNYLRHLRQHDKSVRVSG